LSGVAFAAGGLSFLPLEFQADTLLVQLNYHPFVTEDDSLALSQGEDLVVSARLELWQKRRFWFDRLRQSQARHFLLRYDRWEETFTVSRRQLQGWAEPLQFELLPDLLDSLEHEFAFQIPLDAKDFERRSYLVYTVEVRYVTPEKLDEIASWLTGSGKKGSKSLPDRVLGFLVSSTGIKNRSYLQSSSEFLPAARPARANFRLDR
jgi:hypothetical protein